MSDVRRTPVPAASRAGMAQLEPVPEVRAAALRKCARPPWRARAGTLAASIAASAWLACGCASESDAERSGELSTAVEAGPIALSDTAKRELILNVIERFVPHAETFWRSSDLKEPRTGRYAAAGPGVTQPRGAGNLAFAYVTLLAGRPDQASFGGVAREVLIDHTIQSIRHEALTNALSGAGYNRWGNGTWQASLEAYSWAFAAHRLWGVLDDETRALVRRVLEGEANILITKLIASGEEGDTGAEDNAWNSPTPALAAVMFPESPNASAWETSAIRLALNASSTTADATAETLVDGKPLREWMASVNLHPDLTMENHGFFNPIYQQGTHLEIGDAAITYAVNDHPRPEAFSFRAELVWTEVLGRLALDDGDFAMPAGQDWTSKDFQHLDYVGILATRFQRADASVLESRALELVERRQATRPTGALLGQPELGYETMLVKRLSALYWNHLLFGPSAVPSAEDYRAARAETAGVKQFPYSDFVAGRLGKAFVSMSWDSVRPMGLVIPHGEPSLEDPIFSYYAPGNLIGSATGKVGAHSCACESDRFSTAGTIGARLFSMTAFPDGTTLLLDRGEGATFTYALDDIPGLTGARPIWSESGITLGDLTGSWLNASDRLGMIVRGGPGMRAAAVPGANDQIVLTGATGTGSGNRGALLLPLADHETTQGLAEFVEQPQTPDEWSALSGRATDGSLRLAVARWGGSVSAELAVVDPRGAPVFEPFALLGGDTAHFALGLDAPASRGLTARFFVLATAPLRGEQAGEDRVWLANPTTAPAALSLTQAHQAAGARTISRILAGGERVLARNVAGELTLAGPELEPLLDARAELIALIAELEAMCRPSRHRRCELEDLLEDARAALVRLERAIAAARAEKPDVKRAAADTLAASRALSALTHTCGSRLSQTERAWLGRAVESIEAHLERALETAFTVQAWIDHATSARPGEPLLVRVVVSNRGSQTATNGTVTLRDGAGSIVARAKVFSALAPGANQAVELTLTTPPAAVPGSSLGFEAEVDYRTGSGRRKAAADASVFIAPVLEVVPDTKRLRLASGGVNRVTLRLVNHATRALPVTLAATAPEGATALPSLQTVTLEPRASAEVVVALAGLGRTTGIGLLELVATTATGVNAQSKVELAFTDNLALNDVGAPWPRMTAISNQPPFPPALACDGNTTTFWVSDGTVAGQGPSPTEPKLLTVDFGAPTRIGAVTMVPRVNFGPRGYAIEISDDGLAWTRLVEVPNSPNTTVTSTFSPVTTRLVRLSITAGYDRIQPPRNVQVAEFIVRSAPP